MYFVYFFSYTCKQKYQLIKKMKANFSYMYMCCCYKQTGEGMLSMNR